MHIATLKNLYQKDFFKHEQVLVLNKSNPFEIYWVCKLFEECRPDESFTQRDMLRNLGDKYLYWGRLSQMNEFVPHHGCFCFHCKTYNDCVQILLERGKLNSVPKGCEKGVEFDAFQMYCNFLDRKKKF